MEVSLRDSVRVMFRTRVSDNVRVRGISGLRLRVSLYSEAALR